MKFPTLMDIPTSRDFIDVFGGYNHNLRIGDGEFYDMTNLTSSNYPVLSPRPNRGVYESPTHGIPSNPLGMVSKDALCYVDGGDFVINDYKVDMGLSNEPKTLISMGAYVIIMPDKKWINTEPKDGKYAFEHGDIEAVVETTGTVTFELCKLDGTDYGETVVSGTAPTITDAMKSGAEEIPLWLDTSSTPHSLKQYSKSNAMWSTYATTYIKISFPNDFSKENPIPFNEGDGVTISGINDKNISDLNNTMVVQARGDDYIVVIGIIDKVTSQEEPITIERRMPNMDFVIESGNRLWGCRYGTALNGQVVNEIYASKLGDFKNWHCYAGISTDSYAATVGTDGQFTGAVAHLGYPLFFKENCMHKVYGYYPANYQIQTTTCRGVQKGCDKSLAIVNEVLYYKSRSAVCAYDGSLPAEISSALGEESYSNAVAGWLGNKYYISMMDSTGQYHLFVYDTKKGMWHREDNTHATAFCNCRGDLYFIEADKIKSVLGSGQKDTSNVAWMAETGILGTSSPDKKYISRLDVRLSMKIGTRVFFYIQYDSSGEWEHLFSMTGTTLASFAVPIRPKRCDHMRLRIEGYGEAKIYSISKTIEDGSDV